MPLQRSNQEHWRYTSTSQKRWRFMKCAVLTSVFFIFGFSAIILLIRSLVKDASGISRTAASQSGMHKYERLSKEQCDEVCTTEDCLKSAEDMISKIDSTIDPCEDFYGFSCGKYERISMDTVKRQQLLSDISSKYLPNVLSDIVEHIPKHIPESIPGYSLSKLRRLYDSCLSFRSTEEMAVPFAKKYLEYFGIKSWPNLNNDSVFSNSNFDDAVEKLTLHNRNPFFVVERLEDSNENSFANNTAGNYESHAPYKIKLFTLHRSLLRGSVDTKEETEIRLTEILNDFAMPEEFINTTVTDVLSFDGSLHDIKQKSKERIRTCRSNTSIDCSAYKFDCSNEENSDMQRWCTIGRKFAASVGLLEDSRIDIILEDKIYFQDVRHLIDHTDYRTSAHAIALYVLSKYLKTMNYSFRRKFSDQFDKENVAKMEQDRRFFCIVNCLGALPMLVGEAFYISRYNGSLQKELNEIYEDIRENLILETRSLTWLDQEAQESLEKVLESVEITLAYYLPHIEDISKVDELHEQLQTSEENFLSNMIEVNKFHRISSLLHDETTQLHHLQNHKFVFNPNYQQMGGVIVIDFSAAMFPLISANRPRYSNLGALGSLLSHELSHAVEIFFRDLKNVSADTQNILREKKKCFIDQYSEYEIELIKKKVNGIFTLNENLADYFGLRSSYMAMKKYQERHGGKEAIPGLEFTIEQLFFIQYAQFWCESNTYETMEEYLEDPHSPGKFRVWGIMKNFEPFSEAFKCPRGRPMNPFERCAF